MFKKHRHQKSHYFSKHPSRGLKDLYISVGLKDFALAAVTIFEPIFLFTLGYNLKDIAFYYLIIYGVYFLLLPFFGGLVGRIGLERSIFFSQFILILYFILLFSISNYEVLFYIAPLVAAIYKALYWPAYHTDFVIFSKDKQRGREVGGLETLSMIVYIIGPLVGGAVLEWANFGVLFIGVSILFILSSLPLLKIKEIHGRMVYSYWQSFRHFLDKQHRRNFLAYLGFGEELIVLTMWPIFIFMVVGDYLEIGALVAMATLVTSIVVLFLGKAADKYKRENILRAGTLIYFITWFFRGLATKAWHVFGLDASSRFSKEMLFVPLEVITYNTAKQVGTLSYVVFFEQSLAIAKCLAALLIMIIVSFFTSPWVPIFISAGIFSLFYLFIKDKRLSA